MFSHTKSHHIAAYYFPNFHQDARNYIVHGQGWTEWELVQRAIPRFPGHQQPRVPVWGYQDEADPLVFAHKIDVAANYGLDSFIFDWYWYDDGPFLNRALDEGFLGAYNNDRLQFALMWANHDWIDIHPISQQWAPKLLYPGVVSRATFDHFTDYVIEHYFRHPSYLKIDGCPYFSIYELYRLVAGLGGAAATRDALQHFRSRVQMAGFPNLHLNAVTWGVQILPGERQVENPAELVDYLGFQSVTSYVWIHHADLSAFPCTSYSATAKAAAIYWQNMQKTFHLPYFPNVTVGWDSSPRTSPDEPFVQGSYPYISTLKGNTPEAFAEALQQARAFLISRPQAEQILTINAWNEWTEGSYLEPDTIYGMGYLEAIREVFGSRQPRQYRTERNGELPVIQ